MFQSSTASILPIVNPSATQNSKLLSYNWKTWAKASLVFATTAGVFLVSKTTGVFAVFTMWFRSSEENRLSEDDTVLVANTKPSITQNSIKSGTTHSFDLVEKPKFSQKLVEFQELPIVPPPTAFFPEVIELSSLDGSNGFKLDGEAAADQSGWSVSSAGDVNGDNIADLIIGAYYADPSGRGAAGRSYVVFGHNGTWLSPLKLSSLDGSNGFKLDGEAAADQSGWSVSSAGEGLCGRTAKIGRFC